MGPHSAVALRLKLRNNVLPIRHGRKVRGIRITRSGIEPHVAEVLGPLLAFVEIRPELNLIADFAIAGQIARFEIAPCDPSGRLELCGEIFRHFPTVHEPGGFPSHLATNLVA